MDEELKLWENSQIKIRGGGVGRGSGGGGLVGGSGWMCTKN